jgi:DNA polymerase-3 subunit gamma/tau
MGYQVLARKWRPQDFSAVVGQEPVVTALRNAVTDERIAQAYLFSGIRGVGKTSVARIFAKALNCPERGTSADPCNSCPTCEEITRGGDLDVIEVDAATYSKVEQVRELAESLKYGPARDPYKVVVIDEIHRLSRQAFDALLKIVEEPPEHLVFVFATTASEAVPATILSRCQEFPFRRVPAATLAEHLRRICDGESITASDAALRLLARAGEGSVRDAVALLDQLATYGSGEITDDEAARILGGVGAEFHLGLLVAILAGKSDAVAAAVHEVEQGGRDPRHVFAEFLAYCRDALHLCLGGRPEAVDLPGDEAKALAAAVREVPYERLLRMLHLLLASEAVVRRSEQGALAMEIALLRAAELPKLTRIEELLSGDPSGSKGTDSPPKPNGPPPAPPRTDAGAADAEPGPQPAAQPSLPPRATTPQVDETPPPNGPPDSPVSDNGASIERFLEHVSRQRQPLAAHLAAAEGVTYDDGVLRITAPAGDDWLRDALARKGNRAVLEDCLRSVWGGAAKWRLAEGSAPAAAGAEEENGVRSTHPALRHPTVQAALDIFGGTVESIEEGER